MSELIKLLKDLDRYSRTLPRRYIGKALGKIAERHPEGVKKAIPELIRLFDNPNLDVRRDAAIALGGNRGKISRGSGEVGA
ncbi:MAG: HEAT repeat domain-containing protein [Euryarchaeota archaeon]|nr:HEAT repeat domain-containing protein [Euryarchaeota archaeon]